VSKVEEKKIMKNFRLMSCLLFFAVFFQTAAAQDTKPIRIINGGVRCGKAVSLPKPPYPKEAKAAKISGEVKVKVLIGVDGKVESAEAVSGHELLRKASEQAALAAKFSPTVISGEPVKLSGIIVYNFVDDEPVQPTYETEKPAKKLHIDEGKKLTHPIVNGRASYLPKPLYPQKAEDFCVGGKVEVEVLIGEKGTVIEAKAISGDELLQDSAVEAAKKAKFAPFLINTPAVKTRGIIVYNFDSFVKCFDLARVVNKKAISIPKPKVANLIHPKHLRIKEEQNVTVRIIVDESGKVIYAKAVLGHSMLRGACETSARQSKFAPTLINSGPLKIKAILIYKFKPDGTIEF
jgi:TonB family protein